MIDLLEPIPADIKEAELNIIVIPHLDASVDEIYTPEDQEAYVEAMKDYKQGLVVDMEEYLKERGLCI